MPKIFAPIGKTPETSEQTYPFLYRVPKTENRMQEDLSVRKLLKYSNLCVFVSPSPGNARVMGMVTSSATSDDESDISTPGEANSVKNEAEAHHQHSNDTNRPAEPNGGLQHLNDGHRSSGPELGVNHLSLRIGKLDIT